MLPCLHHILPPPIALLSLRPGLAPTGSESSRPPMSNEIPYLPSELAWTFRPWHLQSPSASKYPTSGKQLLPDLHIVRLNARAVDCVVGLVRLNGPAFHIVIHCGGFTSSPPWRARSPRLAGRIACRSAGPPFNQLVIFVTCLDAALFPPRRWPESINRIRLRLCCSACLVVLLYAGGRALSAASCCSVPLCIVLYGNRAAPTLPVPAPVTA